MSNQTTKYYNGIAYHGKNDHIEARKLINNNNLTLDNFGPILIDRDLKEAQDTKLDTYILKNMVLITYKVKTLRGINTNGAYYKKYKL
tara:strand:- start:287 stop:550 length:264 start_codon:yes stop_codon:yes gene_type:complete